MLKVSRQQQQELPDCLSRENRLGKPGFNGFNFGGISRRKNTGDFPKPFHLLCQNLKWENISICRWDFFCCLTWIFLAKFISYLPMQKKDNQSKGFSIGKTFPCQMANFFSDLQMDISFFISTFVII